MDPIADMLTSIRNAQADRKGKKVNKIIDIVLNYDSLNRPTITRLKRVSKPSRRIYSPYSKIKKIRQGFGSQILSTPKGILSGKEARREKIGGEVICEVY